MKKTLLTVAILVLASLAASAAGISVTGTAERMVQPDLARIELGVETQGDTAQAAVTENATLMTKVRNLLLNFGIPEADLTTSAFSLAPQYRYPKDSEPVLTGYRASNVLEITLRGDLKRAGEVLDLATKAGANRVQNVTFSVQRSEELQLELLAEAVGNGKQRAEKLAQAAGVKMGKLLDLSDSATSVIPYRINFREDYGALKAAYDSTPIQPGQIKISAQVNLQYDLGN